MHLSALSLYPVKSLRGISVHEAAFDELGLCGDRRFLIVDAAGKAITQRGDPSLATIQLQLTEEQLILQANDGPHLSIPLQAPLEMPLRSVQVWGASGIQADDCGAAAADWFSSFLGREAHLVRIHKAFSRPIPLKRIPAGLAATPLAPAQAPVIHATLEQNEASNHQVSFADAFPFLLLSEASLAALNERLQQKGEPALTMDRFRPNLVLSGIEAHGEDQLGAFKIGQHARFHTAGPCVRCIMTTTDQLTGARKQEPLRTLADYRRNPTKSSELLFGQNLLHETKSGRLRVGDTVQRL